MVAATGERQLVAAGFAKGRLLPSKRPSTGSQKAAFYKLKDGLSQNR